MVTEHTRLTIVTDTFPCAAQSARHTWPLGSSRTAEEHLAQHLVGWFVTPHHQAAQVPLQGGMGGNWKQRHLSQNGKGVRLHMESIMLLYGEQVTMVRCSVCESFCY